MCLLRATYRNQVNLLSRLIPESPSWLLVKGRTKEALEQLERVAQCNKADLQVCFLKRIFYAIFWYWKLGGLTKTKKQYSFLIFKQLQANEIARELEKESQMETDKPIVAKATLLQMFKTENLRLNAFLCTVIWWALIDAMMTCNFWWKALSFPSLNVNTLTAWWALCATTATSKTLPIWARAMSTRATSLEPSLRSLAGQL